MLFTYCSSINICRTPSRNPSGLTDCANHTLHVHSQVPLPQTCTKADYTRPVTQSLSTPTAPAGGGESLKRAPALRFHQRASDLQLDGALGLGMRASRGAYELLFKATGSEVGFQDLGLKEVMCFALQWRLRKK